MRKLTEHGLTSDDQRAGIVDTEISRSLSLRDAARRSGQPSQ
jgi:hypothetical protein